MQSEPRRRFALAAIALGAYATCADTASEPYNQAADTEKLDYARPDASTDVPDSYVIRLPKPPRAARSQPRRSERGATPTRAEGDTRTVTSTAYCLTGTMANGQRVHSGAVAMNGVPMGSRWEVVGTGHVYTVADRIGHGSQFDIAMPGDCAAARAYGRRTITIRRVA